MRTAWVTGSGKAALARSADGRRWMYLPLPPPLSPCVRAESFPGFVKASSNGGPEDATGTALSPPPPQHQPRMMIAIGAPTLTQAAALDGRNASLPQEQQQQPGMHHVFSVSAHRGSARKGTHWIGQATQGVLYRGWPQGKLSAGRVRSLLLIRGHLAMDYHIGPAASRVNSLLNIAYHISDHYKKK